MEPDYAWSAEHGTADIQFENGDIKQGSDLEALVVLSLFSDARCGDGIATPDGTDDRRGNWLDTYDTTNVNGSLLWLTERSKITGTADVLTIQSYAKEALQWMVKAGIADRIDAKAIRYTGGKVNLTVTVTQANSPDAFRYRWVWTSRFM